MSRTLRTPAIAALGAALSLVAGAEDLPAAALRIAPEDRQKVEAAIPDAAPARPREPRLVLVVNLNVRKGEVRGGHSSIPAGNLALELTGKKTGAYDVLVSDDVELWRPESMRRFDAVCFMNTAGVLTDDPRLRESLLSFVRDGGGFVGFHAGGGATFVEWPVYDQFPEFGEMVGGYEDGGHPWAPDEPITIRVEDPRHPLTRTLDPSGFVVKDEVFQFRAPYSREKVRVLLSIDAARTDMSPGRRFLPERAADRDFPMSWIRTYGKGRVFYTSFGHNTHMYQDRTLLQHYLAGIQYALGDLEADATPSAVLDAKGQR
jgi:type 1 glutamine amidotransferase